MRPTLPSFRRCEVGVARNCGLGGEKLKMFRKCAENAASWYNGKGREVLPVLAAGGGSVPLNAVYAVGGTVTGKTNSRPMPPCQVTLRKLPTIKPCRVMLARQRYSHLLLVKTGVDLLKFLPQPRTVR